MIPAITINTGSGTFLSFNCAASTPPARENEKDGRDGWKQHGLGHLLNPTDPNSEDRAWIGQIWQDIISRPDNIVGPRLSFGDRPAVGRISISSPAVMRLFASMNEGKPYAEKIKPFNFILTCHVQQGGHPDWADPGRFHLITGYEKDARLWLKKPWIDQYSGKHVLDFHIFAVRQQNHSPRQDVSRCRARV